MVPVGMYILLALLIVVLKCLSERLMSWWSVML